jgi:hypothetical protein
MTGDRAARLTLAARWAFGLWVLAITLPVFFYAPAIRAFSRAGLPDWCRFALGGCETLAAILFLVPRTWRIGAWALLGVFAVAIGVHVRLGYAPHALLIYAAIVAALLWLDSRRSRAAQEA